MKQQKQQPKTVREAWTFLAEQYSRYADTGRSVKGTRSGLCNAVGVLIADPDLHDPMYDVIGEVQKELTEGGSYLFPIYYTVLDRRDEQASPSRIRHARAEAREGAHQRAILATFFAESTE